MSNKIIVIFHDDGSIETEYVGEVGTSHFMYGAKILDMIATERLNKTWRGVGDSDNKSGYS